MPKKNSPVTPSVPSKRRASNRAKSTDNAILESAVPRADSRAPITADADVAPSMASIAGRTSIRSARRVRPPIVTESPDVYIVDYLPNFTVDHRSDTGADRIPCGEVTGIDGIMDEIQARFVPKLGPGYYRMTPRVNGRITRGQWVEYISAPGYIEGDEIDDDGTIEDDIIDDSSDSPAIIRLRERLRYEQKLRAAQNGSGSISDLLHGLRELDAMRGQSTPQKSLAEQIREAKELLYTINPPRREPNPAPGSPSVNPEAAVFQLLARDEEFVEKIAGGLIGKLVRGESSNDGPGWETMAMEAIKSGQATSMVNALMSGLQGIVAMILPQKAQVNQGGQVAPTAGAPAAVATGQQTTQALPTNNQPAQTAPAAAATGDPYTAMVSDVITSLMNNAPVEDAIKRVNGFLIQYPTYRALVDEAFSPDAEPLLMSIGAIPGCEQIPKMPHAKQWIEQFQESFFEEEEDAEATEDEFKEKGL